MSDNIDKRVNENSIIGIESPQATDHHCSSNKAAGDNNTNTVDTTISTIEISGSNQVKDETGVSIMPPSISTKHEQDHHDDGEASSSDNVDGVVALIELASNEIEQIRKQQQQYTADLHRASSSTTTNSAAATIHTNNLLENGRMVGGIIRSFHTFPTACLSILKSLEGNSRCVDCGERNPQWAAVRYGALVCLQCSGHHRSLGVQVSTIRSVTMDEWSLEEIVSMLEGGNAQLDGFFARHALTEDAVQTAVERKVSSSSSSSGTSGSCNSSTNSTSTNSVSDNKQGSSTRPATINKENVIRMRYKTKAALFYRKQMEIHVRNVLNAGPYRGREISRRLKHHPLDKRNSTME